MLVKEVHVMRSVLVYVIQVENCEGNFKVELLHIWQYFTWALFTGCTTDFFEF
jgi:hypothetical protein